MVCFRLFVSWNVVFCVNWNIDFRTCSFIYKHCYIQVSPFSERRILNIFDLLLCTRKQTKITRSSAQLKGRPITLFPLQQFRET